MANNPPVEVQKFGQSIWYDNISRDLLKSGEIQRLVDEDGVMGMTSNPTIFMNAITGGSHYDAAIATMLDLEPYEIYERLALEDIQAAADILRPIYDRSNKRDGYISLEVSPLIAADTEQTVSEAQRLFAAIDRPNAMIKIPATEAGLPAIEEAIALGINVNITLIFSIANYVQVMDRYIQGLERRLKAGQPVDGIASVASFFVSRIDSSVDQHLQNNIRTAQGRDLERMRLNDDLLGTIAIANAKVAYQTYKTIFEGERFKALREAGAMVQRALWASTGTKNPNYSKTLYVDSLIGPDTVNTVPPSTLKDFKQSGTAAATLEENVSSAIEALERLAEVGVDLDSITRMLQEDGVDAFVHSFEELLKGVEGKREMLRAAVIHRQSGIVGGYEPGVRRLVAEMGKHGLNELIWKRDATVWKETAQHQENILNRLGWLSVVSDGRIDRNRLAILQRETQSEAWEHVVLLGMGGSSLAPEVLSLTFGQQAGYPALLVLDSTDPSQVKTVESSINIEKTLFIVASKSGGTLETDAFRRYFYNCMVEAVGAAQAGQHFIAITDEGSELAKQAELDSYRHIFINPSDIGGRYSALSYFGLVPAALIGLDLEKFYARAENMERALGPIIPAQGHPGIWLGALMGYLAKQGHDKLILLCSPQIASFANWIEQLVAESTGKEGVGILPVASTTIGNPHDYDDDRFLVYIRLDGQEDEIDARVQALWEAGHPVFTIRLADAYDLAGEFLRWAYATAVAGHYLNINPFDEPNVTESKKNTSALLEIYQKQGTLPPQEPYLVDENVELYVDSSMGEILTKICEQRNYSNADLVGLLAAHISFARSGDYIALMAYLEMNDETDQVLADIQRRLRHCTTRAVTRGYGPRFLHSTGQFHKGGPAKGNFIQITVDDPQDLAIPGLPFSFGILKQAQALGDQQALMKRELPFVRLHIKGDVQDGLQKILHAVAIYEEKRL